MSVHFNCVHCIIFILTGYTCDYCGAKNFEGFRYHCEVCFDYDLCSTCYDDEKESLQHSKSHPIRCIHESEETLSKFKLLNDNVLKIRRALC
jgi:hypothetical protein